MVVSGHVVGADLVVKARAGSADGRRDVVAGPELWHGGPHLFDLSQTLMTENEVIVARRRRSVFRGVDLLVGAVHAHAQDFDQHTAPVGHILKPRFGDFAQVDAVRFARNDADGFHEWSPSTARLFLRQCGGLHCIEAFDCSAAVSRYSWRRSPVRRKRPTRCRRGTGRAPRPSRDAKTALQRANLAGTGPATQRNSQALIQEPGRAPPAYSPLCSMSLATSAVQPV